MSTKSTWRYYYLQIAIICIATGAAYFILSDNIAQHFHDLLAFWSGYHMLSEGMNLYSLEELLTYQQTIRPNLTTPIILRYPPHCFILLAPLLAFDYANTIYLWVFANITIVIAATILTCRFWNIAKKQIPFMLILCTCFLPIWRSLEGGQLGNIIWLTLSATFLYIQKGAFFRAGILSSFLLLKPHLFLLFLPLSISWIVRERRHQCIIGFILGLSVSIFLALQLSPDSYSQWLQMQDWGQDEPLATVATIVRTMTLTVGLPPYRWLMWAITSLSLLITIIWLAKKKGEFEWSNVIPGLLPLSIAFAPYAWPLDYACLSFVLILYAKIIIENLDKEIIQKALAELTALHIVFFLCYNYRDPTLHALYPLLLCYVWVSKLQRYHQKQEQEMFSA